jgi:hypothetical protein
VELDELVLDESELIAGVFCSVAVGFLRNLGPVDLEDTVSVEKRSDLKSE